jgi:hypothetical protein
VAGIVEILLKLKGDSKDAVGAFDKTTNAAKKTETQVRRTSEGIYQMLRSITTGQLTGVLGDMQSWIQQAADLLNQIFNIQGRIQAGREAVAGATSPAALAGGFVQQAGAQASGFSVSRMIENLVTGGTTKARRQEELRNILLGQDVAVVAAALPYLPKEYRETGQKALDTLRARQRGAAYQSTLVERGQGTTTGAVGNVTINNRYPVGVNPRAVDQNMSRYERVNGRPRRP